MPESNNTHLSLKEESTATKLLVLLRPKALSYALMNDRDEVLSFKISPFKNDNLPIIEACHQVLKSDEKLQRKFNEVRIGLSVAPSSLIPARLFDENAISEYGRFLMTSDDAHVFLHNHISELEFVVIHKAYSELLTCFQSYFANARFYHVHTGLMLAARNLSAPNSGPRIYLHIHDQHITLLAFENRQLMQYIEQAIQDEQDLAYFLMLMFNQMEYNPEQVPVYLMGEIERDSRYYNAVYRFVRNVHFVQKPGWVSTSEAQNHLRIQHHYDLFSILLCA